MVLLPNEIRKKEKCVNLGREVNQLEFQLNIVSNKGHLFVTTCEIVGIFTFLTHVPIMQQFKKGKE